MLTALKVIGTVTLGCLSGALTSFSIVSVPAILLQRQQQGNGNDNDIFQQSLSILRRRLVWPLGLTSSLSFLCSFLFAPRHLRHPYLIYSALIPPVLYGYAHFFLAPVESKLASAAASSSSSGGSLSAKHTAAAAAAANNGGDDSDIEAIDVPSDLGDSVYKDLGQQQQQQQQQDEEESDSGSSVASRNYDQQAISSLILRWREKSLTLLGVSFAGFFIATVGIFGDLQQ